MKNLKKIKKEIKLLEKSSRDAFVGSRKDGWRGNQVFFGEMKAYKTVLTLLEFYEKEN